MIKYEVTAKVPQGLVNQYLNFLQDHIQKVLESKGFMEAQILVELSNANRNDFVNVRTLYAVASNEDLEHYFSTRAPQLRQESIDLFGNQIEFSRKVWTIVNTTGCIHK